MEMTAKDSFRPQEKTNKPQRLTNIIYLFAFVVLAGGTLFLYNNVSFKQSLLYIFGAIGGFVLYHARFGFTSAWRQFILYRQGEGIRAQMIMLLAASLLFLPLLMAGSLFGQDLSGYVFPVGTSVLVGAFIFGIGMQMGDGCASGTLYHIGGGDMNGVVTLTGFIAGSVIATTHFEWWQNTPQFAPISFIQSFGPLTGFLIQFALLAFVYWLTLVVEKRKYGKLVERKIKLTGWKALFRGPWPLVFGGLILAVLNAAILIVSGKPWGITSAFALWGAKAVQAAGGHPENWSYWQDKLPALEAPVYYDVTTVMDISLMVGALLAAALAGRFRNKSFRIKLPGRMVIGSLIGGLMMGYGARLSFGCNIGAFFDGIASFSVHGWLWFVFAYIGSIIGVKFRPYCQYKD
ncbi:MAG TPA: YeeE/YedE family protein [Chondromyces sp.]|nr:YeeE/YedE family protein [Chondromyces sp.]